MNFADIAIIMLFATGLARGSETGCIRQICSTLGTSAGVALGVVVQWQVVRHVQSTTTKSLLALLALVICGAIGMWVGEMVGFIARDKIEERQAHKLDRLDRISGSLLAGATVLAAVWLAANLFAKIPGATFQEQLKGSAIIARLNRTLPEVPPIVSNISHLIAPNGFPDVFASLEPRIDTSTAVPSIGQLDAAVQQDRASVVKIMGQGCGGIVEGSGFVVDKNLVVTNAHVVAGVAHPTILDGNGQHNTTVVAFDPDLDIAVLRSSGLSGNPLTLNASAESAGTATAVLGYPGGGDFTAQPAAVLRTLTATGRNIYSQGSVMRDIYALKSDVEPGNSGGPLVDTKGEVVGVIFARSTAYQNVGYALTIQQLVPTIQQAEQSTAAVNTQTCSE
jgi:S1-C subfamily serine protease